MIPRDTQHESCLHINFALSKDSFFDLDMDNAKVFIVVSVSFVCFSLNIPFKIYLNI